MLPSNIKKNQVDSLMQNLILSLHTDGGIDQSKLETLAYIKINFYENFSKYENTIVYILGLFYKAGPATDIISTIYSSFRESIKETHGSTFSPMQSSILAALKEEENFSFSAPTSAGKSFLFRSLLLSTSGDIVFVVPSRALIFEYILQLRLLFKGKKHIMIQQFIDKVNTLKTSRRIFVVTPERAMEIFNFEKKLNIDLFLFDEAQISEERVRGITFDTLVRKVSEKFPKSKKMFAHPFVENPKAQLVKHELVGKAKNYRQSVVGKQFLEYNSKEDSFSYFSPYYKNGHFSKNKKDYKGNFVIDSLKRGEKVLIYISKSQIVDSSFVDNFKIYIDICEHIQDQKALNLIDKIRGYMGDGETKSVMLNLLKCGIVIHHGSVPLIIRSLLEEFTSGGYAKICFSTSTLLQGVNMPFDIVWVYNYRFLGSESDKVLGLKNLIGRAGRSSKEKGVFDTGTVITQDSKRLSSELKEQIFLKKESVLDSSDVKQEDSYLDEFIESVKNDTYNEEEKLPVSRIERLQSKEVMSSVEYLLKSLFINQQVITGKLYKSLTKRKRNAIKMAFHNIFEKSLGRKLEKGEKTVLSKSITILLWQIQGKSFKEILKIRFLYLVDIKEKASLKEKLDNKIFSQSQYNEELKSLGFAFSASAVSLPNKKLKNVSNVFKGQNYSMFNYDLLVYDTYDFLDKVIAFSLSDIFCYVFKYYYQQTGNSLAQSMQYFFKYGTNDITEIMLLRYGFSFDDIKWLVSHVDYINEEEIRFLPSISKLSEEERRVIENFI